LTSDVVNGRHDGKAYGIQLGGTFNAFLVHGTGSSVGSSPRESNAESPAGLVDLDFAFICALMKLVYTSFSIHALGVLVGASLLKAFLHIVKGIGLDDCQQHYQQKKKLHSYKEIINQE
jgi:hypothetical protein